MQPNFFSGWFLINNNSEIRKIFFENIYFHKYPFLCQFMSRDNSFQFHRVEQLGLNMIRHDES